MRLLHAHTHKILMDRDVDIHMLTLYYLWCFLKVQANFFITYVLTSGWVSLSSEVVQVFALVWSLSIRYILRQEEDTTWVPSFPYHTEVPRILLFGLIGFTCSILAPLIVPFLLIYFLLAYVVYRNQVSTLSIRAFYCDKFFIAFWWSERFCNRSINLSRLWCLLDNHERRKVRRGRDWN